MFSLRRFIGGSLLRKSSSVVSHPYAQAPALNELDRHEISELEQRYPAGQTPELENVAEFERYWVFFFQHKAFDDFEVQRGMNNCFAYDITPTVPVIEEALKACRRHNTLATAIRIFGGLRDKVPKESDYDDYVEALRPLLNELGVPLPEELGRYD